jgi:hypothetical protein
MARHRTLLVFITHGRADDRLPFAMAERMVALVERRGSRSAGTLTTGDTR